MGDSNRLVLVVLEVTDAERSAALYRDAFGVELHLEDHGGDDRWISGRHAARSWYEGSYLHLALYEAKTSEVTTRAQVGFTVDDIEDAHRVAVAAGAEVVHPPRREPWGSTSRYRDLDGNVVSLTQQDPSSR